jgi:copper homeostasis protein (lipoprotein)
MSRDSEGRMTRRRSLDRIVETFTFAALFLASPALTRAAGIGPLPAWYSGTLPCADCMGIRMQLNLYAGGGYMLASTYLRDGRDETVYDIGAYSLSADSTKLMLHAQDSLAARFSVQNGGTLRKLDRDGREIANSAPHELRREAAYAAFEPRLTLRGSYARAGEAASFTDCRSGLRFPVAPGGEVAELEKVFATEKAKRDSLASGAAKSGAAADVPLVVSIQGRIAARAPAGGEGNRPTLVVERFLAAFPGETCGARVTHALDGTRWVLTRLGTEPVRLASGEREAWLTFDPKATKVTGFGGCNNFSGSFVTSGAAGLKLGALVSTKKACPGRNWETPLLQALAGVASRRISGAHLELLDAAGVVVARFEARNL